MSIDSKRLLRLFRGQPIPAICGLVVFVLILAFYFRGASAVGVQSQLDERNKHYRDLKANVASSVKLDEDLRRLVEYNKKIADGALRVGDIVQNLQFFYKIESETGVKLVDLRQQVVPPLSKGASPSSYVGVGFSLSIEGDYEKIILFCDALKHSSALAKIANFSISKSERGLVANMAVQLVGTR